MSPSTGLEFADFGYGGLLDNNNSSNNNANNNPSSTTNNGFASSLSDFAGGPTNGDFFSSLFDSSSLNMNMPTGMNMNMNGVSGTGATSWQKKALLDQQQQQLQQEQNSLNALLSQHSQQQQQNGNANMNTSSSSNNNSTPNPFGFATREDLETLSLNAAAAHAAATANNSGSAQQQQQQSMSFASQQQQQSSNSNANNGYMFMATIVDPNQEDSTPQQMLFLPGSNQVIPMPGGSNNNSNNNAAFVGASSGLPQMMALANLPVVFPQGTSAAASSNHNSVAKTNANDLSLSWSAIQNQQQQQQQQLFSNHLNGFSSTAQTGTMNLEDIFAASSNSVAVGAPTPLELALSSMESQQQHMFPTLKTTADATPARSASLSTTENKAAAMPIRPLSAYNFFFSDERERILQNRTDETDVFDSAKKQRLLLQHLAKDRTKRRPHRKTHGKINFTTLSKLIGARWKQLPDERKNFYREVAAIDLERYQRELRERSPAPTSSDPTSLCN